MRLVFVVQRYGEEIGGGAEALCRWLAERMQKYFAVEVWTTCALDYLTWANHYPAGRATINSVPVQRFPVDAPRDMKTFNALARTVFAKEQRTLVDELNWLQLQGPYSSALLNAIKTQEDQVDRFVFVTYSYLTTFLGLQLVPRKSLLIPAAHDEPHFYFTAFQPLFHLPLGIIYNTNEEQRLVQSTWQNAYISSCVAGVGVTPAPQAEMNDATPAPTLPDAPYLLYIGRIDVMKGCQELCDYFLKYLPTRPDLHLVLMGKTAMEIPAHPQIHALGFLPEGQKQAVLQKATILVNPSAYESLSLVVLEAWQAGLTVLVNGRSDVLAEHCLASNGGLYYTNYDEFALGLDLLLSHPELRATLGKQGQAYVAQHYSWDEIEKTYVEFILKLET